MPIYQSTYHYQKKLLLRFEKGQKEKTSADFIGSFISHHREWKMSSKTPIALNLILLAVDSDF